MALAVWYIAGMNDDTTFRQRIAGRSVRAFAKAVGRSVAQINEAIDRWAESATDKIRKHTLAELARLDELQETFYARALEGDVSRGALVTKIVERRCVMLGLHTPQSAVLQIVDETKAKETSIDKIERVLAEFAAQKKDDPTTH
jgi:hypothetical protein